MSEEVEEIEEEEEQELSDTVKKLAGLATVGVIVGLSAWIALAQNKDTALTRFMAQQGEGGDSPPEEPPAQASPPQPLYIVQQPPPPEPEPKSMWESLDEVLSEAIGGE
jgi:hypothetical protein